MNTNQELITVLIAIVENDKKYLDKCIKSLKDSAKYANVKLEFILIANGTKLSSKKYPHDEFNIVVSRKNIGFGQAINQGIKKAKGKWCIIACPDTYANKYCIKRLIKHTNEDRLVLIAPKITLPDGDFQYTILPIPSLWNILIEQSYLYKLASPMFRSPLSDIRQYTTSHYVEAVAAIWWMIKRDTFLKVGGFDKRFFLYFEDVDLCKRIRKKGYKIAYEPEVEVTHLPHQSTEGIVSGKLYAKSLKAFLLKHYDRIYSHIVLIIFKIGCLARIVYWSLRVQLSRKEEVANFGQKKIRFCKEALIGA